MRIPAYSSIVLLFVRTATIQLVSAHQNVENDTKCPLPPFVVGFPLSDGEVFDTVSTCPFSLHQKITGQNAKGCFPIYDIPQWGGSESDSYEIKEFNIEAETSLFFERSSSWEDLSVDFASSMLNLEKCIESIDYKVEGIKGEISGTHGSQRLSAIVLSFKENSEERNVLLPIGGCGFGSHLSFGDRKLEVNDFVASQESCSIRPKGNERSECLEKCYASIEADYVDEITKLISNRNGRMSKNIENQERVFGKLVTTRTSQLSTAFARCKCKHSEQDLGHCFLRMFLDVLVSENEQHSEVKESFDRHMDEVDTWFQNNSELLCDKSTRTAMMCRNKCHQRI